jgi:hypothetical protein
MLGDSDLSQSGLQGIRKNTLKILGALELIPTEDIGVLSNIDLSKQASRQKDHLGTLHDDKLLRDMRLLAGEARNDIEALIGGNDPHVDNIGISFVDGQKDSETKTSEVFEKVSESVYSDLKNLTDDFSSCYNSSNFKQDFRIVKGDINSEKDEILKSCYELLQIAEKYVDRIMQDNENLAEDNKNLIRFLEREYQKGDIKSFYKEKPGGKKELGLEKFKKELKELKKFLEVEEEVHNELKSIKNNIERLKEAAFELDADLEQEISGNSNEKIKAS